LHLQPCPGRGAADLRSGGDHQPRRAGPRCPSGRACCWRGGVRPDPGRSGARPGARTAAWVGALGSYRGRSARRQLTDRPRPRPRPLPGAGRCLGRQRGAAPAQPRGDLLEPHHAHRSRELNSVAEPTAVLSTLARPRPRPSFAGAVRSELLKIRGQALTWIVVAAFVVVSAATLGSVVASGQVRKLLARGATSFYFNCLEGVLTLFNTMSGVFLLVVSSRLVALEYSSGTIRTVLAKGTGRLQLLGAQLLALAISGLVLLAAFIAVCAATLY